MESSSSARTIKRLKSLDKFEQLTDLMKRRRSSQDNRPEEHKHPRSEEYGRPKVLILTEPVAKKRHQDPPCFSPELREVNSARVHYREKPKHGHPHGILIKKQAWKPPISPKSRNQVVPRFRTEKS